MLDVIVMAGGKGKRLKAGCPKAIVRVGNKLLYEYVLGEALKLPHLARIFLVAPRGDYRIRVPDTVTIVPTVGTYLGDVFGVLAVSQQEEALIVNADGVLLTTEHLATFLNKARTIPGGLVWPVVKKHDLWPEVQATPVSSFVGNHSYTQGNAALVHPREIRPNPALLEAVCRQPALREILTFGTMNCLRALFGKLPLDEVASLMSAKLNCQVAIRPFSMPELGFDIDYPIHLQVAQELLKRQGRLTLP